MFNFEYSISNSQFEDVGGTKRCRLRLNVTQKGESMKIAIPTAEGKLAMHFGHCEKFAIVDVDNGKIESTTETVPPPHEPGVLPKWLHELGVNVIIAGGMGNRAQELFAANEIEVIIGASAIAPEALVQAYIDGSLVTGDNVCDH